MRVRKHAGGGGCGVRVLNDVGHVDLFNQYRNQTISRTSCISSVSVPAIDSKCRAGAGACGEGPDRGTGPSSYGGVSRDDRLKLVG